MRVLTTHVCAVLALLCVTVAPTSYAVDCKGYSVTQSEKPIVLKKKKDGPTASWFWNERVSIGVAPGSWAGNRSTGVCGGGWIVAADGKSGEGQGFCSYVDVDGDMWHITYEGSFEGGTWETVGGTGKFVEYVAKGTWKPTGKYRFSNGWGSSEWEGECSM